MADQTPTPDICQEAAEVRFVRPPKGRHAIPRTSALIRLRLPLGKALALTALPAALVLGSQRPAADTSATAAHSVPEEAAGGGADCARRDEPSPSAAPPTPTTAPSTPDSPGSGTSVTPPDHIAGGETSRAPAPSHAPSTSAAPTGLLDSLLEPLLGGDTERRSPAPEVSPSPESADSAAPTPTVAPHLPSSHLSSPPSAPRTSPSPGDRTTTPPPRPTTTTEAIRTCDLSDLKAPEDTSAGRFAAEAWNMKGSRLHLRDVVFGGVVTVDTAAGPKRVLKFSAAGVTIRDLRMSVPVGPQIQHIDGAPGSTSTLRGDHITMYVESLTGTLSGAEGIPLPPVLRLRLTPDTVPEWLYDTVGKLGLKLQLGLDDVDIDQAGQTGGDLTIPGIHGYGTTP
ncbi:hypothetical protein ABZT17_10880 [Streptomyces sp. NPDC005648]|uniref:hypothetical protein n=1 Tax=Streptomyces sp. NPDC005648 TaxID=3157044 RepID=UPI0033B5ABB7